MRSKIVAAILLFAGQVGLEKYSAPKEKAEFVRLYNGAINGRITKLERGKIDVSFSIDSKSDQPFYVYPINSGGSGSFRTTFS